MKTLEYSTVDKSRWPAGPWQSEPDKRQWRDEATGLPCLIVRNRRTGILCGYVGVSRGHPLFEQHYDAAESIGVHGGLTFADRCQPGEEAESICHVVEPGEDDAVWWLGFDCAHSGDHQPCYDHFGSMLTGLLEGGHGSAYRDFPYVAAECASLARQLFDMQEAA